MEMHAGTGWSRRGWAPAAAIAAVTSENLRADVLAHGRPALVHCFAKWSAPCRAQEVELASLARASGWRFRLYALDVHLEEEVAAFFAVRAAPTLIVLRGQTIIDRFVGLQSAARLRSALIAAECGQAPALRRAAEKFSAPQHRPAPTTAVA